MEPIKLQNGRVLRLALPTPAQTPRALLWWASTGSSDPVDRVRVTLAVLDVLVVPEDRTWPAPAPSTPWPEVGDVVSAALCPDGAGAAKLWLSAVNTAKELDAWLYPPEAADPGNASPPPSSSDASSGPLAGGAGTPDGGGS